MQLIEEISYIMKPRKRFTFETVSNFLEIYKSIVSTYFEHMIVFLYGIQQILRHEFEPYSKISKVRTSDKINSLKKDPMFKPLVESYRNDIRNSNPTDLTNLFDTHPEVQFLVMHSSYPYGGELSVLAKNYPNVNIDMCWSQIISPSYC